jgi:hypothetical protein
MHLRLIFVFFLAGLSLLIDSQAQSLTASREFGVGQAKQGIAVDERFFYVINNRTITRHTKADGKRISTWDGTKEGIVHLNSGVVIEGKLYCANSNYPEIPMASSVEIFDANTLRHIGTHSFGIAQHGSLTWLDQHDEGRDVRWTSLVKYDLEWRQLEAWVFPKNILELFAPKSNSGGAWGSDGLLYLTGHDRAEVYVMKIPKSGYILEHVRTLPAPIEGQGIAIDRSAKGKQILYGIKRASGTVTVSEISPDKR